MRWAWEQPLRILIYVWFMVSRRGETTRHQMANRFGKRPHASRRRTCRPMPWSIRPKRARMPAMLTLWEAPSQGSLTRLPRLQVQGPPRLVEDRRRLDGEEGQRFLLGADAVEDPLADEDAGPLRYAQTRLADEDDARSVEDQEHGLGLVVAMDLRRPARGDRHQVGRDGALEGRPAGDLRHLEDVVVFAGQVRLQNSTHRRRLLTRMLRIRMSQDVLPLGRVAHSLGDRIEGSVLRAGNAPAEDPSLFSVGCPHGPPTSVGIAASLRGSRPRSGIGFHTDRTP